MFRQLLSWRIGLALVAIAIVSGTVFYSQYLAKKIAADERKKVDVWVQSLKTRATTTDQSAINLTNIITSENKDIPIIETDEKDNPSGNVLNMDSALIKNDKDYLKKKTEEFKAQHEGIELLISKDPLIINRYYYGDSQLLQDIRYYPLLQLFVVALFIIITLIAITTRNKSTQNQVWAGLAKEAAHQLGTPISSLQGWIEILKESPGNEKIALEMVKDIDRLELVSDRFGKIGSIPQLEEVNIVDQMKEMVAYIKRRSPEKVNFILDTKEETNIPAMINAHLFDWVIENLLKNALDAMEGKGVINIKIRDAAAAITIDVKDSGKGISKQNLPRVFKPGFTTKMRGWGLGLSLSKRIIEQYHQGELFVKSSDAKGTTFRIILKK
jgi:signal transduction histidine kinase